MLERLVHGETRADRRDLEQHAARLAEVDRLEVEAVDDGRRMRPTLGDALLPSLVLLGRRRPGAVVDGPGAGHARLVRRLVVGVPATALVAAHLPDGISVWIEVQRLLEEAAARAGIGEGAHAVEPLQRELARDLGM